jgi:16S rRNA (cytosine967-C5)-methyltransferase
VQAVLGGRSLDTALAAALPNVDERDRGLLSALAYGCIRHHWQLRHSVSTLLQKPLRAADDIVMTLLAIGVYQMQSLRMPDHAAVSATVEATRLIKRPHLAGLVNAVLRNYRRRGDSLPSSDDPQVIHDHPAWLLDALQASWPDRWQSIVAANNQQAPMWLRVNARRSTAAAYCGLLEAQGIKASTVSFLPQAVKLAAAMPVDALPGFADGVVSVQDGAAQFAAEWLAAAPGMRVLDACAAPGGKTAHILELADAGLELVALDHDAERLKRVDETLGRLGLEAALLAGDASRPADWWDGRLFDRILVDAPCSATGVIRRHPDIKHLRQAADIPALAALQGRILEALWPLLAPGGRLIYATCSVLEPENAAVVEHFINNELSARAEKELRNYNIRAVMQSRGCGYQILPGDEDMDGFFYACLERR